MLLACVVRVPPEYKMYGILGLGGLGILFGIEAIRHGGTRTKICGALSTVLIGLLLYVIFLQPVSRL